jgi:hypothetical protein
VDWEFTHSAIEKLLCAPSTSHLFEGLYGWSRLHELHVALAAVATAAAGRQPLSSMGAAGCWNGCRLLGRHLETKYSLSPIQVGWAQQQLLDDGGSEAADGLLAELMKEAFGDTSIPTPLPTPSPSVLCTIVATQTWVLGVAALVGGGRYFAAQLQAAQAAGAVRADQYRIGVKMLGL